MYKYFKIQMYKFDILQNRVYNRVTSSPLKESHNQLKLRTPIMIGLHHQVKKGGCITVQK